jgi:hypothetical protein
MEPDLLFFLMGTHLLLLLMPSAASDRLPDVTYAGRTEHA